MIMTDSGSYGYRCCYVMTILCGLEDVRLNSIDWPKGNITGKSHVSWENLWFPVDFPLSQPIDELLHKLADTIIVSGRSN